MGALETSSNGNAKKGDAYCLLGTPLTVTTYARFRERCYAMADQPGTTAVDFSNTQIVVMRRHEPAFREITSRIDYFIPDGMPLIWYLNTRGAQLADRVYGPTFMREFLRADRTTHTHYFLGGSADCVAKLRANALAENPELRLLGSHHGYFKAEEEAAILEEINRLGPDFIWVGLGTPRQQAWIHRCRPHIKRGVFFAVGFAFDVNAGTKPDAPMWMQRLGLTWLFRAVFEPRRLGPRYFRYNTLFLFYLLWDGIRGRLAAPAPPP